MQEMFGFVRECRVKARLKPTQRSITGGHVPRVSVLAKQTKEVLFKKARERGAEVYYGMTKAQILAQMIGL